MLSFCVLFLFGRLVFGSVVWFGLALGFSLILFYGGFFVYFLPCLRMKLTTFRERLEHTGFFVSVSRLLSLWYWGLRLPSPSKQFHKKSNLLSCRGSALNIFHVDSKCGMSKDYNFMETIEWGSPAPPNKTSWDDINVISVPSDKAATSLTWLLSTWHMATAREEQYFSLYWIWIHLNFNRHTQPVATTVDSASLDPAVQNEGRGLATSASPGSLLEMQTLRPCV